MLIMMNYVLNNEKKQISDFITLKKVRENNEDLSFLNDEKENEVDQFHYNTIEIEKEILNIVSSGDLTALDAFVKNFKTVRNGNLGISELREAKDMLIVATTLISRQAIKEGVDKEEALLLSDNIIQKCELTNDISTILSLNYQCIYEFTKKVSFFKRNNNNELANKVTNYILNNISKRISLDELAKSLYMSKSNLCLKFKEQNNKTLNDFILEKKIQYSLNLLKKEDVPLSNVSEYLGFSSLAHFSRTFKNIMGFTPSEYRKKQENS